MAVFYDTGGGDIYGGPDKESVVAAMREDMGDDFDEDDIEEFPGDCEMPQTDDNGDPTGKLVTLDDEYSEELGAYCIASNNC